MSDSTGKKLKAAREARGLSLEDVVAATKIRSVLLRSLEEDDYKTFASVTHARNFLSQYGKYLQVDVSEGLSTLTVPSRIGTENYQYLNVKPTEDINYRPASRTFRSMPKGGGGPSALPNPMMVFGLIAVLLLIGYLAINLPRLNFGKGDDAQLEPPPTPIISNPVKQPPQPKTIDEPKVSDRTLQQPISDARQIWHPYQVPQR